MRKSPVSSVQSAGGDGLFALIEFKNGTYHGELSMRQKTGLGAFYWDSGEFYFGRPG